MGRRYETVSLLSDLGGDESSGVLRAVLRDLAPHAVVVDLTHDIPPFDVRAGALALARCIAYVPSGVVVAAVDPDAGGGRPPIAIEVAGGAGIVVGPDNGLLAPAIALAGGAERAVILDRSEHHLDGPGATNPARDVYVPVAAALCNGLDLAEVGTPTDPALLFPSVIPLPRLEGGTLVTEVLWVDRFGNAELNIGPDELVSAWGAEMTAAGQARVRVLIGDDIVRSATVAASFGEVPSGALALVLDSNGMYALALSRSSAAEDLRLSPTDEVRLEPLGLDTPWSAVQTPIGTPVSTPVGFPRSR